MAAFIAFEHRNRRVFRRHRVFRDRTHPLEVLDNREVFTRFRFPRHFILELTDEICDDIEFPNRRQGALLLTLRFYATGTLQNVIGDLFGVTQSTASRTISRVTDALLAHVGEWIVMPNQEKADRNKVDFFDMQGFPNVIGCVDGTQIRIQAPFYQEHEFVNRKNFHSINVQVSWIYTLNQ
ncbi:putative nuclease HARBI1 [Littorina saxatilis]|uniref:Nuclease HARBI1 n=1 Tax=Littorina saxatilis TaxID=31220 RepID=A0AAN9G571_9CAEN